MGKHYIRKRDPLWKGGQSTFICTGSKCIAKFKRKDEFKKHWEVMHGEIKK